MNHNLMRDVAIPRRSPIASQTPNAFHSIKYFKSYKRFIYCKSK
jgi:hypothetical protein